MVSAPDPTSESLIPKGFLTEIQVEPVGRWFLSHWERLHSVRGTSLSLQDHSESESESEESESEVEFEDDLNYLRTLDPKDCKNQDHYKVLGIYRLRHKASDDVIKKAYRHKVLRHHPDKRRAAGEEILDDDDYFTCITKAYEILGNPVKRVAFDSVDPLFDDGVPEWNSKKHKDYEFYGLFAPVFNQNARWSTKKRNIPDLGNENTSREDVEKFYKFWYEFDSWREFSYLDEEDKEKGSDREERRWIEKNNKIQRAEKKKEEMKRIRKLVDNAYNNDPRIIKFKEQDKAEKLARKKAKQDAIQARKDEEERIRREAEEKEKAEKERIEAEAKAKAEEVKKEKEILKKAIKKERKTLRNYCKEYNYFSDGNEDLKLFHMTELDKLCEVLDVSGLGQLNNDIKAEIELGNKSGLAFKNKVSSINKELEKEKIEMVENASGKSSGSEKSSSSNSDWSTDELALLIKAVNLFPAGTNNRWEVISSFINQHSNSEIERKAKETLTKAKELQQGNFHTSTLKDDVNKKAYENLEKTQKKRDIKIDDNEASKRTETAAEVQGINPNPWTEDEQKLLEQALKTYKANLGTERWERIADTIPNRSKKDCMKRYKELAEIVRAKKAAAAAAAAGNARK